MKVPAIVLAVLLAPAVWAEGNRMLAPGHAIALPGVAGRLDHLAVDAARQRLFIAARDNDSVEVIDLQSNKRLPAITGVSKPQGVLFLPKANVLFVASSGEGRVKIFDCDSFRAIKTVGSLPDADNLRYDALSGRVYVGYGTGALGVIQAVSGVHTIDIELRSHPESFQLEAHSSRVFVNLPGGGGVAVVDRLSRAVEQTWELRELTQNFPMALDEHGQRLYIGCRKPPRLAVLDTATGKILSQTDLSGDADDLFLDLKRKRLYACCGEGFVDVFELREGGVCVRVQTLPTAAGARTGLFAPDLDLLCLAVPQRGTQQCEVRLFHPQP